MYSTRKAGEFPKPVSESERTGTVSRMKLVDDFWSLKVFCFLKQWMNFFFVKAPLFYMDSNS